MKNKIIKNKENNLNKKIMDSVYTFERKRTYLSILKYFLIIILIAAIVLILSSQIIEKLIEQQTLDLLDLFNEDFEIIKKYIFEVSLTFYEELPQILAIYLLISLGILSGVILAAIKNYKKLKNKLSNIIKYFKHL